MAFTDAQKVDIRRYIGAPDAYRQDNTRLESSIIEAGDGAESEAVVVGYLAEITAINARLIGVVRSSGGIKQVDEVEFFGDKGGSSAGLDATIAEGRMWASRLSQFLGTPLIGDFFGTRGFEGFGFTRGSVQVSGGEIPFG